jgi:hemolysin activation/secretion protein
LCVEATAIGWVLSIPAAPAYAQTAPVSPPPPSASQLTPRTIAPEASKSAPIELPQAAAGAIPEGAEGLFFAPSRIDVDGGFPEMAAETNRLLTPIAAKQISVAQFYEAAALLQAVYAARGFALARVSVPPQPLKDGRPARIAVVDGFLENIDVGALPKQLRYPVHRTLAPLLNRRHLKNSELERRLTLAGDISGASIRSTLARGEQPGGAMLVIEGKLQAASASAIFDDRASAAFAHRDFNMQAAVNSPFGIGEQLYGFVSADPLAAGGMLGPHAPRRSFGGGVYLPVGYDGIRFNIEATKSITQPLGGFFRTRDVFTRYTARLSFSPMRTRTKSWTITPSLETSNEVQSAPDFATTLSHDHYRVARLASELSLRGNGQAIVLSSTVSVGFGAAPGATEPFSRAAATRRFIKVEASATYQRAFPLGFSGEIDLRGQTVLKGGLPSGELFGLDGTIALSSFTSGALSADEGATARGVVRRPFAVSRAVSLSPYGFAAYGYGHYAIPTAFDTTHAGAYGGGVDIDIILPRNAARAFANVEYGQQSTHGFLPADHRWAVSFGVRF